MSGEVESLLAQVEAIRGDLRTLAAAIKIVEPDFDLRSVKPKRRRSKNEFFEHGEATRFILDTLREATRPLSTTDIVGMAIQAKGLDPAQIDRKALGACILTTLSRQRVKGVAVEAGRAEDGAIRWELAARS